MPRANIEKHFLLAFEGKLNAAKFDVMEDAMFAVQDIDAENLVRSDLPFEVPVGVRDKIMAAVKERNALNADIEHMLAQLEEVAEKVYDRRNEAEEAKKPHCKECGQVLKTKKGGR